MLVYWEFQVHDAYYNYNGSSHLFLHLYSYGLAVSDQYKQMSYEMTLELWRTRGSGRRLNASDTRSRSSWSIIEGILSIKT
jgi:hypothetical protein